MIKVKNENVEIEGSKHEILAEFMNVAYTIYHKVLD